MAPDCQGSLCRSSLFRRARLLELSVTPCKSGGAFGSGVTVTKIDFRYSAGSGKDVAAGRNYGNRVVLMVKLTALFPPAMVTLGGTWITDGLSVLRLTTPPSTGAGITNATEARSRFAANNILAGRANREHRRGTSSRIDFENARLRATRSAVMSLDQHIPRQGGLRSSQGGEGRAQVAGGDGHIWRGNDLAFHAGAKSDQCAACRRRRSESNCSGDRRRLPGPMID